MCFPLGPYVQRVVIRVQIEDIPGIRQDIGDTFMSDFSLHGELHKSLSQAFDHRRESYSIVFNLIALDASR